MWNSPDGTSQGGVDEHGARDTLGNHGDFGDCGAYWRATQGGRLRGGHVFEDVFPFAQLFVLIGTKDF